MPQLTKHAESRTIMLAPGTGPEASRVLISDAKTNWPPDLACT